MEPVCWISTYLWTHYEKTSSVLKAFLRLVLKLPVYIWHCRGPWMHHMHSEASPTNCVLCVHSCISSKFCYWIDFRNTQRWFCLWLCIKMHLSNPEYTPKLFKYGNVAFITKTIWINQQSHVYLKRCGLTFGCHARLYKKRLSNLQATETPDKFV